MADRASQAKLKVLAQWYRNGGAEPTPDQLKDFRGDPDPYSNGTLSDAGKAGQPQAQNVSLSQSEIGGAMPESGGHVGTMDDMAAARAKMLQLNNASSQQAPEPDLSGYQAYNPQQPLSQQQVSAKLRNQADLDTKPNRFQQLRQTISPTQALTPEQESGLFPQDEDEDDATYPTKTTQFSTPTT
jgi:hypothetical protein